MTTFGGPSTSSRATFVQRATSSARRGRRSKTAAAPQMTKRSGASGRGVALPAARVVAAEDGALDDRRDLALLRHRQRVVERPRDRAGAAVGAHDPGRGRSQALGVDALRLHQRDPPRPQLAADLHDRDRVGVGRGADQAALEQRVEPRGRRGRPPPARGRRPRPRPARRRSARPSSRGAGVGTGWGPEVIACFYHRSVRVRILGSAAGGGFPQWNCRCPTCEAARTGAARGRARSRRSRSAARRGRGSWPTRRPTCASSSRRSRRARAACGPHRSPGCCSRTPRSTTPRACCCCASRRRRCRSTAARTSAAR